MTVVMSYLFDNLLTQLLHQRRSLEKYTDIRMNIVAYNQLDYVDKFCILNSMSNYYIMIYFFINHLFLMCTYNYNQMS